jgi:hypothetical protein
MDQSIRRRESAIVASPAPRQTLTLAHPAKATAFALRRAILECAAAATTAEPSDTDARVHSFIARMSATMEGLGERELDAALWGLMETKQTSNPTHLAGA